MKLYQLRRLLEEDDNLEIVDGRYKPVAFVEEHALRSADGRYVVDKGDDVPVGMKRVKVLVIE